VEKSLTELAPQARPREARRVRSSDPAPAKDLERALTELERSLTDLPWASSSEHKTRPNFERSLPDVAHTRSADWERSLTKFERSITDLGLTKSDDVDRSLSELKRSLTDLALAKVSDLDLTDSCEERSLTEFVQANSSEQQSRTRTADDSADLRDNTSFSSISVDDLYKIQEAKHVCHDDGTRPTPVSREKEDLSTEREQKKDTIESWGGEPCDSTHLESPLPLANIYIMSDLKNLSNSSIHQGSEESLHENKLSPERTPEVEHEKERVKKMVDLAVENDSSKSSFRDNTSLQGSFGLVSSTSLDSGIGEDSRPTAPQGERDQSHGTMPSLSLFQSHWTPKEGHRSRRTPAPTSTPARIRRAPSRSYSAYSGTNSFLDDIADVTDEEESSGRTKEEKSGRRGRRRYETNDAKLARIERETKQDLHKSWDGSFHFQL
jgi:hypothetical protein